MRQPKRLGAPEWLIVTGADVLRFIVALAFTTGLAIFLRLIP